MSTTIMKHNVKTIGFEGRIFGKGENGSPEFGTVQITIGDIQIDAFFDSIDEIEALCKTHNIDIRDCREIEKAA